jgi:urease subunit gamma/beta
LGGAVYEAARAPALRLTPREQDRLLVFLAAELARRRRARGLRLSQAEATALITDEVMEAARDGASYAETERRGYEALGSEDVARGVEGLVERVEVEALFADGNRLIVLHRPVLCDAPPAGGGEPPIAWLEGGVPLPVTNEGGVPVGVTSHFHFFESNRDLRFERRAAWGRRLAVPAGAKVVFEPGETVQVRLVPFGGRRVIRGHGGLVNGPLDEPGALERALELARERGYRDLSS